MDNKSQAPLREVAEIVAHSLGGNWTFTPIYLDLNALQFRLPTAANENIRYVGDLTMCGPPDGSTAAEFVFSDDEHQQVSLFCAPATSVTCRVVFSAYASISNAYAGLFIGYRLNRN